MHTDHLYIQRCLQLAAKGAGMVAPNPMVGAVLVYHQNIIGEGWHREYGKAHAEVNCINSVKEADKWLIPASTMYVSLEPCAHFGKTPPCADLIIKNKIKKVVIGCIDSFAKVSGQGIQRLRDAGVEVVVGDWEKECRNFNKRFFTFHQYKRPYIILKWAQSANGKIAAAQQKNSRQRLLISNELTNRVVHKWRSEAAAIMVGKNTALLDNPSLTNRLWTGRNPVRIVTDKDLAIPESANLYNREAETIIFNQHKNEDRGNLHFHKIAFQQDVLLQVFKACYDRDIQSILVEGGAALLQSFIDGQRWDECRIITNTLLHISGKDAPLLTNAALKCTENVFTDKITYFAPLNP